MSRYRQAALLFAALAALAGLAAAAHRLAGAIWPLPIYRLLLIGFAAALFCILATATLGALSVTAQREKNGAALRLAIAAARLLVGSLMTAVLYAVAIFITSYLAYLGPFNLVWGLGIPLFIALLECPRPAGALYAVLLAVTGFIYLAAILLAAGLPVA